MDIKLVVFDLDGTLIGAKRPFTEIKEELKRKLEAMGIPKDTSGELTPMYEGLIKLSKRTKWPFEELYSILVELEVKRMEESYPFPGAREVLEFLRKRGIKLALMTRSSRKATVKALKMHSLEDYFDIILTRDDVPPEELKPSSKHLRRILEEINAAPEKTIFVGDHGYDVLPAKELGALSVLVTGHQTGRMSFQIEAEADFEVENLVQLKKLFERLLSTYVVVPAYNEEKTIGRVLEELLRYFKKDEVIVVNDGSRDKTEEIARSYGVHVLTHLVNRGLGGALGTGFAYAIRKNAKLVLTFDADGQHLIEDALRVMKPVAEGKADFAVGSRLKGDTSEMPFIKKFGNFVLDAVTALFAGKYISDSQSGLRCLSGECLRKIRITCDRYAVSSEIIIEASKAGCKIVEVPIKAVYTEYSMKKGTNVLEGVKIALNLLLDKLR
ncbi:HAD-IA family hydrolase [Thermococcus sp.]